MNALNLNKSFILLSVLSTIFLSGLISKYLGIATIRFLIKLLATTLCVIVLYNYFMPSSSLPALQEKSRSDITWNPDLQNELNTSKDSSKIIMVDNFAAWCATCQELEEETFTKTDVQQALKRFSLVKVDFTDFDKKATAVSKQYEVPGLPTILFLTRSGTEIPGSRITGFIGPSQFISHLQMVETKSLQQH